MAPILFFGVFVGGNALYSQLYGNGSVYFWCGAAFHGWGQASLFETSYFIMLWNTTIILTIENLCSTAYAFGKCFFSLVRKNLKLLPQSHPTPLGWTGMPAVSQTSSPQISVGPHWCSFAWTGANLCNQVIKSGRKPETRRVKAVIAACLYLLHEMFNNNWV